MAWLVSHHHVAHVKAFTFSHRLCFLLPAFEPQGKKASCCFTNSLYVSGYNIMSDPSFQWVKVLEESVATSLSDFVYMGHHHPDVFNFWIKHPSDSSRTQVFVLICSYFIVDSTWIYLKQHQTFQHPAYSKWNRGELKRNIELLLLQKCVN